ncbi:MAG: hypothetical protein SFU91_13550 [Chloroherpetonaceae bacterium]|nr:hypothetical protein [Chloroherpetonaceae bacterium]
MNYARILIIAVFTIVFSSCKSDNNPTDSGGTGGQSSSFTLNGTTYTTTSVTPLANNVTSTIDGETFRLNSFVPDAFGVYVATETTTVCGISGTSGGTSVGILLGFSGQTTGTYQMVEDGSSAIGLTVGSVTYLSLSGQIVVSEYGNVGGRIRGTFSGTFTTGSTTVQIPNGSFNVTRGEIIQ